MAEGGGGMKKVHKDGTPVKIQRNSNGIRYLKGQERAKVITFLKDTMRAYTGKAQGFEAHRDKTIFELGFYTGFRVEEIYHIDIEDVCHPESLPHEIVLKPEIIVVGKGDVLREVPVTKPLRDALEAFLKAHDFPYVTNLRDTQVYVHAARDGLTVFLVSHDMDEIRRLCDRVLWLDHGTSRMCGDPFTVTDEYLKVQ